MCLQSNHTGPKSRPSLCRTIDRYVRLRHVRGLITRARGRFKDLLANAIVGRYAEDGEVR